MAAWTTAELGVAVVAEDLEFRKKKAWLRQYGKRFAGILSGFRTRQVMAALERQCCRRGVELIVVDPAWTTRIHREGRYPDRYRIGLHQAAALVIGRRGLGFAERLPKTVSPLERAEAKRRGTRGWESALWQWLPVAWRAGGRRKAVNRPLLARVLSGGFVRPVPCLSRRIGSRCGWIGLSPLPCAIVQRVPCCFWPGWRTHRWNDRRRRFDRATGPGRGWSRPGRRWWPPGRRRLLRRLGVRERMAAEGERDLISARLRESHCGLRHLQSHASKWDPSRRLAIATRILAKYCFGNPAMDVLAPSAPATPCWNRGVPWAAGLARGTGGRGMRWGD